MPFIQQRDDPLSAVVNVRMTLAEKAELKDAADLAGLSVSEYVRRRALGRVVIAHADAAIIKELRRLGGLVKHLHNESHGAYDRQTAAVLVELQRAIQVLSHDRQKD